MKNENQSFQELNQATEKIKFFYYQITDIWKRFCEEHVNLFNLTCDEYTHLLKTDLETLEDITESKSEIINRINILEKLRSDLIISINEELKSNNNLKNKYGFSKITTVSDLLGLMKEYEGHLQENYLENFNALLIDIIEKIQKQNKKNQVFINKAILSLKDIKGSVDGKKSYSTYTQNGLTTNKVNQIKKSSKEELGRMIVKPS
jgi:flagellar biosynthesis/type III secretory pathway chaperone